MNFNEIFFGEEKVFNRKVATFHSAIFLAAVMFLYLFSFSTSPRYESFGDDSAIFQAVGKCWTEGLLPYVGAFENKGALLFAIDALGYLIYPRDGIFLLQVPFMYFSMLFTWRAVELFCSRRTTFAMWLLMIFWRAAIFYEGNRTEEYSMPFLLAGAYFFLRWLKDEKNFLPPSIGFFYGLGFGACVLLRTTNGLPICCYVLLTTFLLIRAGAFKNILQTFLSFWAGFATICLPFVIYFAAHGALYEMIYGTILINISHATSFNPSHEEFMDFMGSYFIYRLNLLAWLVVASAVALMFNRKSFLAWSGLFTGAAMLFMLMKGRPFYGYPELIAALLPLMFAVFVELRATLLSRKIFLRRVIYSVLFVAFLTCTGIQVTYFCSTFTNEIISKENAELVREERQMIHDLQAHIPADEKDSVVLWGESRPMGIFILESDILPRCRFFGNVTCFFGKSDPAVIDEWLETARRLRPKWIVYNALSEEFSGNEMNFFKRNFRRQRNFDVEKILNEDYVLVDEMSEGYVIKLYRLDEREARK